MNGIADAHAVVTGAARGIGAAIAAALSREGARVTLMSRDEAALAEQVARLDGPADFAVVDVADEASVQAGFDRARARFGDVGILVNNAGRAQAAPFHEITTADWSRTLAVNLTGAFLCTRQVIATMTEARRGRVINVASTAALKGVPRIAAYCASKHGLLGLTRALAVEVAKRGVTVNAVCPGYTDTAMAERAVAAIMHGAGRSREEAEGALARSNAIGRLVQPDEVAAAVVWLCSDAAAAITGQAIVIGGEV